MLDWIIPFDVEPVFNVEDVPPIINHSPLYKQDENNSKGIEYYVIIKKKIIIQKKHVKDHVEVFDKITPFRQAKLYSFINITNG